MSSTWDVLPSVEVVAWLEHLSADELAIVNARVERLSELGNVIRMPLSRALGEGLFELRFDMSKRAQRITYWFLPKRAIRLGRVFTKTRDNEVGEVGRARRAMRADAAQT